MGTRKILIDPLDACIKVTLNTSDVTDYSKTSGMHNAENMTKELPKGVNECTAHIPRQDQTTTPIASVPVEVMCHRKLSLSWKLMYF